MFTNLFRICPANKFGRAPGAGIVGLFTSEAAAKQPHMVAQLHYDIFCILFRLLDKGTLYNCSVVNKEFNFIASQNLYRRMVVPSYYDHVSSSS